MDASMILLAVAVVGGVGLLIGLLLGVAGKKFAVETDERVEQVREHLAGSNCGGCGFAGCDACAEAMVAGTAAPNVCAPAGAENAKAIGISRSKLSEWKRSMSRSAKPCQLGRISQTAW